MTRNLLKTGAGLLVALVILTLFLGPWFLIAPLTLVIGWWPALVRLWQGWHPGTESLLLFVLTLSLTVSGTHLFLRRVCRSPPTATEPGPLQPWRWKWTFSGFGLLFFSLLAITGMILTTHQLYWISRSSDPLLSDPFRERLAGLNVARLLQAKAEEVQWNASRTRAAFQQMRADWTGQPASETLQPIWIEQGTGGLRAIIIIPRRPLHRAQSRLAVIQPRTDLVTRGLDELPQVLAAFGITSQAEISTGAGRSP